MNPASPNVLIILPTYDRVPVLKQFLECLRGQTYRHYELLLVDDHPTGEGAKAAQEMFPNCHALLGKGNWWWGGSLHQAYRWVVSNGRPRDGLVLIMNDDTTFQPDFLESAVREMEGRRHTLLLAQAFSQQTGKLVDPGVHLDWSRLTSRLAQSPEEVNCLSTRGLFLWMEDFVALGGLYPRLLPHYGSDSEYTYRAFRRGMKLVCLPTVKLWAEEDLTGYVSVESKNWRDFLRQTFSKKCKQNPVYFSMFILLCSDARYIPWNLVRVWGGFLTRFARAAFPRERDR
jgi:GT2 family glycosyltransferase